MKIQHRVSKKQLDKMCPSSSENRSRRYRRLNRSSSLGASGISPISPPPYSLRNKLNLLDINLSSSSLDKSLGRQFSEETKPSKADVNDVPLSDNSKSSRSKNKNKYTTKTVRKNIPDLSGLELSGPPNKVKKGNQQSISSEDSGNIDVDTGTGFLPRLRPRGSTVAPVSFSVKENHGTCKHLTKRLQPKRYNRNIEEDDEDTTEEDETPDGRRYPLRNRRHPDVYQVIPQVKDIEANQRNWLADESYGEGSKRPRHGDHYRRLSDSPSSSLSNGVNSGEAEGRIGNGGGTSNRCRPHCPRRTKHQDELEETFLRQAAEGLMPINFKPRDVESGPLRNRLVAGAGLTDVEPMSFDTEVTFADVGGHQAQIRALQESVLLPLVYPEVFNRFGIEPPRGVLFHGPPGTGKTLLARALANECTRMTSGAARAHASGSTASRPIAFFMRKGADCLSKWIGETERQLRLLFDQAYRLRPSIIFFDELDGLAPVRSSRQDQVHSSIVSTLLALMDGLDRRAEVVVIGATNRPDAIDPALRRPGRFDREFVFSLPNAAVRRRILEIHTSKLIPLPSPQLLNELAEKTVGFCGADLKALATEACFCCLRRQYPQVYVSKLKLAVDLNYLVVDRMDWLDALKIIRPANLRVELDVGNATSAPAAALASTLRSNGVDFGGIGERGGGSSSGVSALGADPASRLFLEPLVHLITARISRALAASDDVDCVDGGGSGDGGEPMVTWSSAPPRYPSTTTTTVATHATFSPALIRQVIVEDSLLPSAVFSAVWRRLESVEVYTLNLASLYTGTSGGLVTSITQIVAAARRSLLNQHQQAPTDLPATATAPSTSPSNIAGVVLFVPRIDLLLARLPAVACHHLVERLLEVTSATMDTGYGAQRRLLLVATVKSFPPSIIPSPIVGEEAQPQTTPGSLSIRVPPAVSLRFTTPPQESAALCNGHASPKTIAWLREQQTGERSRSKPSIDPEAEVEGVDGESTAAEEEAVAAPRISQLSPLSSPGGGSIDHLVNTYLRRLFRFPFVEKISLHPPSDQLRRDFLSPVFFNWFNVSAADSTPNTNASSRPPRPPTPPPSNETTTGILDHRQHEMTAVEVKKAQETRDRLLRHLRVELRRVVAQLTRDRRFTVFMRPVNQDEAPDYYEVIRRPMSLGAVRAKIDAHQYTSVKEFSKDLELIYKNALEYNPVDVPRSREIRERAFELWDAAEMLLDENSALTELEEQVTEALAACPLSSSPQRNHSPHPVPHSAALSGSSSRRYSRRLHGEQPIFGPEEVNQLNNTRQVSRSLRHSSPPDKKTIDNTSTSGMMLDGTATDATHQLPSHLQPDTNAVATADCGEEGKSDDDSTFPASSSPLLAEAGTETEQVVASSLPPPPSVKCLAEGPLLSSLRSAMTALLQEAVTTTRGWSVSQLMALQCDLLYALQRTALLPLDVPGVKSKLSSILQNHYQMVIYDRCEETTDAPNLKPYSPLAYL
ncbi:ATPase family AAA domain containing protein 2B [Echinococcus multilocularis]|uniref:ATPase family AAA domain containing protein 2B n=1 Tax=Echinococcus multilocularis TaxID=6211 RepID=A0A087W074_ECHMU|nr:ATPase family AAA domain containing protein 2B [Echinococcus multilocularis]